MPSSPPHSPEIDESKLDRLLARIPVLKKQMEQAIIGQPEVLDQLILTLLAGGHALLEGVPGLAKTLMIQTLAQALDLKFRRIQFTPDLMPGDIIGTDILEQDSASGRRYFKFNPGPIFANIVLADEINRTPPKTQSALLEAMQERAVTFAGERRPLDAPFFVLATQNPIEQAGTYPLPEAQLDRFLLHLRVGYPNRQEEFKILEATTGDWKPEIEAVLNGAQILQLQTLVRQVTISPALIQYTTDFVRATRPQDSPVEFVQNWVRWGAGPRAGQAMILTAKAAALTAGRLAVTLDDLQTVALPVFRHRVLVSFKAEGEGIDSDRVTGQLLKEISAPKSPLE